MYWYAIYSTEDCNWEGQLLKELCELGDSEISQIVYVSKYLSASQPITNNFNHSGVESLMACLQVDINRQEKQCFAINESIIGQYC